MEILLKNKTLKTNQGSSPREEPFTENNRDDGNLDSIKKKLISVDRPKNWTSNELLQTEFKDVNWIIPNLIPEGLTILGGAPKLGKSWLVLMISAALSTGTKMFGKISVEKTKVLLVSLEDTPRRLKNRLEKIGVVPSENLTMVTSWPHMPEGLLLLEEFIIENPEIGLIVIDTFAKIRSLHESSYQNDYHDAGKLKELSDLYSVPIIIVHHTRKTTDEDWINMISGSTGITGAADTICGLFRHRGKTDAILHITGRDVDEQELAVTFEMEKGVWNLIGDAAVYKISQEKRDVLQVIKESKEPIGPKEISEHLGKNDIAISRLVTKLKGDGFIETTTFGKYVISPDGGNNGNSSNTVEDNKHKVTDVTTVTTSKELPLF